MSCTPRSGALHAPRVTKTVSNARDPARSSTRSYDVSVGCPRAFLGGLGGKSAREDLHAVQGPDLVGGGSRPDDRSPPGVERDHARSSRPASGRCFPSDGERFCARPTCCRSTRARAWSSRRNTARRACRARTPCPSPTLCGASSATRSPSRAGSSAYRREKWRKRARRETRRARRSSSSSTSRAGPGRRPRVRGLEQILGRVRPVGQPGAARGVRAHAGGGFPGRATIVKGFARGSSTTRASRTRGRKVGVVLLPMAGRHEQTSFSLLWLLMYSRLLPDPTNLPGVVGQGGVFLFIGLAYYDVAGIGTWIRAERRSLSRAFLPGVLVTPTESSVRRGFMNGRTHERTFVWRAGSESRRSAA